MRVERSAGTVVYRERHGVPEYLVLLIERASGAREWVFPKGHVEEGETHVAAALRELYEEAHIKAAGVERALGRTRYTYQGRRRVERKIVQWFLVRCGASQRARPNRSEGMREARWQRASEALCLLTHESDRDLLRGVST